MAVQFKSDNNKAEAHRQEVATTNGIVIKSCQLGYMNDGFFFSGMPNSAWGWTLKLNVLNCTGKTINHIVFTFRGVDATGGPAVCEARGSASYRLNATGPLYQGNTSNWLFENFVYSRILKNVLLEETVVEYSDGTVETLSSSKVHWRNR